MKLLRFFCNPRVSAGVSNPRLGARVPAGPLPVVRFEPRFREPVREAARKLAGQERSAADGWKWESARGRRLVRYLQA